MAGFHEGHQAAHQKRREYHADHQGHGAGGFLQKLRRAKERVEHSRPYFETLHDTLTPALRLQTPGPAAPTCAGQRSNAPCWL